MQSSEHLPMQMFLMPVVAINHQLPCSCISLHNLGLAGVCSILYWQNDVMKMLGLWGKSCTHLFNSFSGDINVVECFWHAAFIAQGHSLLATLTSYNKTQNNMVINLTNSLAKASVDFCSEGINLEKCSFSMHDKTAKWSAQDKEKDCLPSFSDAQEEMTKLHILRYAQDRRDDATTAV